MKTKKKFNGWLFVLQLSNAILIIYLLRHAFPGLGKLGIIVPALSLLLAILLSTIILYATEGGLQKIMTMIMLILAVLVSIF